MACDAAMRVLVKDMVMTTLLMTRSIGLTSLSAFLPLQKVTLTSLACELGHTSPVFGRVSKTTSADVWDHHLVH